MITKIRYVGGCEGSSFHIGDIRVAGPKAWGGGTVKDEKEISVQDILYALNNIYYPPHQPLKTAIEECERLLEYLKNKNDRGVYNG